jgi:ADP-ribosyl-[dinitrogen reductase] hydrolase
MPVYRVHLGDVRERAYAALLGVAIGDALGATLEFMTPKEIRAQYGVLTEIRGGGWLHLPKGAVTDDTEMTLCIARSLAQGGWSLRDIAERFASWLKSRPCDVGGTCRRGIRRYLTDGSLVAPPCDADAGNGAVMRMAPVAIASLANDKLLQQWALGQAHITHHHALSDTSCLLVGRLVHLACIGHSMSRLRAVADAMVVRCPELQFVPDRGVCSAYVVDTMRTVLHHLFTTQNFADCLIATVNVGGDSDTAGAIVGAIAGAFYGLAAIPRRWIAALSPGLTSELKQLATILTGSSPLANGEPVADLAELLESYR